MGKVKNKTKKQLIEELEALCQRVAELVESEDKCERSGGGLRNDCQELFVLQHDLRERVKELTCLHNVARLMVKSHISLDKVFNSVVNIIKDAWQYPEIACSRIVFDGKEFKTDNFKSTEWKQSSDIKLNGKTAGTLEVYYLEKKLKLDEGPFLKEERAMIDSVVEELGNFVKRKQMEQTLKESEERYRALLELDAEVGEAVVMLQDTEQGDAIQAYISDAWTHITGYSREELLGSSFFDFVHPKYRKTSIERHRKKMAGENMPGLFEMLIVRKDGAKVPIELTSAHSTYKGKRANVAYIRDITERKRTEKELRRSESRLRLLSQRAIRAQEEERARIARELHDQLSQELVVVRREALSLTESLKETAAYNRLADLVGLVDKLLDTVHNMSIELRPKMLDELGLVKVLQWYTEDFEHRTGISCLLNTHYGTIQEGAIRKEVATAAYRIFQEAMANALRHSKADKVVIDISIRKGRLIIAITDNGIGIDTDRLKDRSSLGLLGMMERASIVGGSLRIRDNPGRGTRVAMYLPLQRAYLGVKRGSDD